MISKYFFIIAFISTSSFSQYITLERKENLNSNHIEISNAEKIAKEYRVHEGLLLLYTQMKFFSNQDVLKKCEINQRFGGPPATRELITLINTTYPARLNEISRCHYSKLGTEIGAREISVFNKISKNGGANAIMDMITNAPVGVPKTRKDLDFCPEQEYTIKNMLSLYEKSVFYEKNWCENFPLIGK